VVTCVDLKTSIGFDARSVVIWLVFNAFEWTNIMDRVGVVLSSCRKGMKDDALD